MFLSFFPSCDRCFFVCMCAGPLPTNTKKYQLKSYIHSFITRMLPLNYGEEKQKWDRHFTILRQLCWDAATRR
jgi:hypothetical protein